MSELGASVMDHASDPSNRASLPDADAIGRASLAGQPPYICVYLKTAGLTVAKATFEAQGCGYTIACCSVLTELVTGQGLEACSRLDAEEILGHLPGIPPYRQFCAKLAIEALRSALAQLPAAT